MKTVAIMQPYIFPYIGYFQLINAVDRYVVYDDVNYISRGWINRNNILVDGNKKMFTISVSGSSSNKLINELEIQDDFRKFEKTIKFSYAKAPYASEIVEIIQKICGFENKNLAEFAGNSLKEISNYLGIDTDFIYSSKINKGASLKGQEKILTICKKLKASKYINPEGGVDLYKKEDFDKEDIELKFLKPKLEEYEQFNENFIPGLSIIDVMMFNSPSKINKMLSAYELL